MCIRDSFIVGHLLPKVGESAVPVGNEWSPYESWTLVQNSGCLLYTSDAADERSSVDLGGRRIIKKKKKVDITVSCIL